jgi:hypothetical protein
MAPIPYFHSGQIKIDLSEVEFINKMIGNLPEAPSLPWFFALGPDIILCQSKLTVELTIPPPR